MDKDVNKTKVSIIVPTYNEEADIENTVDSLIQLTYPNREIIVVDDSTDSTPDIVRKYEGFGVKLIHRDHNKDGRCGARNVGIREASGDIVILLNADVMLEKDFIERILPHYENRADYVLVESKVANQEVLFARFVEAQHHYNCDNAHEEMGWTEGFSCRRHAAIDIGLFPSDVPIPLVAGGDAVFSENLAKNGYKKVFDDSIVVTHTAPHLFRDFWKIRKERTYPLTDFFSYNTGIMKITIKAILKSVIAILRIITIIPIFFKSACLVKFSDRGYKDLFSFAYVELIQTIAFMVGNWQGLLKLYKYCAKHEVKKENAG